MFRPKPWAEAFMLVADGNGGDVVGNGGISDCAVAEEALEYLRVFCRAVLTLPGDISGRNDAYRVDRSIRAALARGTTAAEAGGNAADGNVGDAGENNAAVVLAERFVQLMIRKGCFNRYKGIIREIEKIIERQKGIEEVIVEAAAEPEEKLLEAVREKTRRLTGAREIKLTLRLIPALIGGLRLRWGSRVFDGSVAYRLKKMAGDIVKNCSGQEA